MYSGTHNFQLTDMISILVCFNCPNMSTWDSSVLSWCSLKADDQQQTQLNPIRLTPCSDVSVSLSGVRETEYRLSFMQLMMVETLTLLRVHVVYNFIQRWLQYKHCKNTHMSRVDCQKDGNLFFCTKMILTMPPKEFQDHKYLN